jgi:hypothetical protein
LNNKLKVAQTNFYKKQLGIIKGIYLGKWSSGIEERNINKGNLCFLLMNILKPAGLLINRMVMTNSRSD